MFFWNRPQKERILIEDALKHIFNCQDQQAPATPESISNVIGLRGKRLADFLRKLADKGLIRITGNSVVLTSKGRNWALQVIRAHRLWESYLSQEVGLPLEEIHTAAERQEHLLTPEEVNHIEEKLGYPSYDPHGDPIPTASFRMEKTTAVPLLEWPTEKLAKIVHIEDEPYSVYAQILAEGILLGSHVKILEKRDNHLKILTNSRQLTISSEIAANIYVEQAPEWARVENAIPLSTLKAGEKGKVLYLQIQGLNRRRFMDLGLIPGTVIEVRMNSAFGEPKAYFFRGTLIALRREQAEQIIVQKVTE